MKSKICAGVRMNFSVFMLIPQKAVVVLSKSTPEPLGITVKIGERL